MNNKSQSKHFILVGNIFQSCTFCFCLSYTNYRVEWIIFPIVDLSQDIKKSSKKKIWFVFLWFFLLKRFSCSVLECEKSFVTAFWLRGAEEIASSTWFHSVINGTIQWTKPLPTSVLSHSLVIWAPSRREDIIQIHVTPIENLMLLSVVICMPDISPLNLLSKRWLGGRLVC